MKYNLLCLPIGECVYIYITNKKSVVFFLETELTCLKGNDGFYAGKVTQIIDSSVISKKRLLEELRRCVEHPTYFSDTYGIAFKLNHFALIPLTKYTSE